MAATDRLGPESEKAFQAWWKAEGWGPQTWSDISARGRYLAAFLAGAAHEREAYAMRAHEHPNSVMQVRRCGETERRSCNYRLVLERPGQGNRLLGHMASEANAKAAARACAAQYPKDCGVIVLQGFESTCVVWYAGKRGLRVESPKEEGSKA